MLRVLIFAVCITSTVDGHGQLTWPPSTRHGGNIHNGADCSKGECYWFSNNVEVAAPTLPASMRSMEPEVDGGKYDVYRTSPWRAPGTASVYGSGCGVAGGHPTEKYANGGVPPEGIAQGYDGIKLPAAKTTVTLGATKWVRGGVAELAWATSANHAGGYAYRMCKSDSTGGVTEECFQKGHLSFADDATSFIVYPNGTRVPLPRAVTTEGTHPEGSQWARLGVPTCRECDKAYDSCGSPLIPVPGLDYGTPWNKQVNCYARCSGSTSSKASGHCPAKTQFAVADNGPTSYSGFGKIIWHWSILDRIKVPSDIPLGKYIVSWRWDCEESTQVWQNCADVTIVASAEEAAYDVASAEAIATVPKPTRSKADNSGMTEKGACSKVLEWCVGKGKVEGKCGATKEETLSMNKCKDTAAARGDTVTSSASSFHPVMTALATAFCVASAMGLLV